MKEKKRKGKKKKKKQLQSFHVITICKNLSLAGWALGKEMVENSNKSRNIALPWENPCPITDPARPPIRGVFRPLGDCDHLALLKR